MEITKGPVRPARGVIIVFALSLVFWAYLGFATTMNVAFDSVKYEEGGRVMTAEGLGGYLRNGPRREPLYASTIALSMRLGEGLDVDYKKIQTFLQLVLLFVGQYLLYRLLLMLQLKRPVIMAALLYYGFSPGMVGCGLDLYSEIVTLPFILLSVIAVTRAWGFVVHDDGKGVCRYAVLFAISAIVAALSKAVLTVVYPLLILPFVGLLIHAVIGKRWLRARHAGVFLIVFFLVFNGTLAGYKYLNKQVHGKYTYMDDRAVFVLYTVAVKRTAPLTKDLLGVALTSVPGEKVCRSFYGQKVCHEWLLDTFFLGMQRKSDLKKTGMSDEEIDRDLIRASAQYILSKPFQYGLFAVLEGLKMFFWESTKIGFVTYPDWISAIHDNAVVKSLLRLAVGLGSMISTVFLGICLLRFPREGMLGADTEGVRQQSLFFMFYFVLLFVGMHSLFVTLVRYSLPIAPVFIAMAAFFVQQCCCWFLPQKESV